MTLGHPPVIAVWDDARQQYVLNEDGGVCTARWASAALGPDCEVIHGRDELCGRGEVYLLGDAELCAFHFDRALHEQARIRDDERRERILMELARERDRVQWPESRLLAREQELDERERQLSQLAERLDHARLRLAAEFSKQNVVYYLRRSSDGLIKIGTTRNLPTRMSNLRKEHGETRLLLTHKGGLTREGEMHGQFAALRVTGEWFRPERVLLEWIVGQREREDIPLAPTTVPLGYVVDLISTAAA